MSLWLRDHADHHMMILLSEQGPPSPGVCSRVWLVSLNSGRTDKTGWLG